MRNETIAVPVLQRFMAQVFQAVGVPAPDAEMIAAVLVRSDLRGIESHGVGRLQMYIDRIRDGIIDPVTRFDILRESPGTALVDGHNGMGHVISVKAMQLAIKKARQTGIAAVAVRNSTHFGIAGYYPLMAIDEDMAGLAVTNARPAISPTFGTDPMMGTNPIAFGIPTDNDCPFLLDMATSISQRGKIEVHEREGKAVPEGWIVDEKGEPLTDAAEILQKLLDRTASLLPLGGEGELFSGHKGYGLAMMVEILSSLMSGGPFGLGLSGFDANGQKIPHRLGHFFVAIDIAHFIEIGTFKEMAGDLLRSFRHSTKLPGEERIYTAGEKEFLNEKRIAQQGVRMIPPIKENLIALAQEFGLQKDLVFMPRS